MTLRILFYDDVSGNPVWTGEAGDDFDFDLLATEATQTDVKTATEAASAVLGAVSDAKVDTDATGTISAKLRGGVSLLATIVGRLPSALGAGGGLKVDGSGTALPVSGTVTANVGTGTQPVSDAGGSLTVDGPLTDTELRATAVPVSATVLGATSDAKVDTDTTGSISAKLRGTVSLLATIVARLPTALGAGGGLKVDGSGTALPVGQSGTWTVQPGNTANTTAWKVDGSAVTQPVSGTVTATPPTYTAPACGELAGATSATQMPNVACKMVQFRARSDNAGSVYIGVSGVTAPNGSTDTTTGLELVAGQSSGWIPVDNMNRLYRICANAGDDLTYLVMN